MDKKGRYGGIKHLFFLVYLIIGLIFLNEPFQVFPNPDITDWWIMIVGLMLIIAGGAIELTLRKPAPAPRY